MFKTAVRCVLLSLCGAALSACGVAARAASVLPLGAVREARSAAQSSTAPSVVQYFTYQTAASSSETSSTVTLGTSGSAGHAPAAGDLLVVLIGYADTGSGATIAPPTGFAAASGGAVSNAFAHQAVYTYGVSGTAPTSLTFKWSEPVSTQIWVVEVADTAGVDAITSATASETRSPWSTSTGTGTQSGLDDLGLAFASVADAILTAKSLGAYTQVGETLGNHGDGTNSYGSTSAVFSTNAPITTASVPAQTVGWTAGSGTEAVLGEQVLLRPAAGSSSTPTPSPTATASAPPGPSGTPTVVQEYTGQTAASSSATSAGVTLGTSGSAGHAPATGDLLVALVGYADTGSGATITPPSGFTAAGAGALSNEWAHQAVYTSTVSGSAPGSVTFSFSEAVSAQIWVVDVANASGVDAITSATGDPSGSPWNTSTGTGTQSGLDDVGLVFVSIADALLGANSVSSYTQLGSTLGNHGNANSYGSTSAAFRSNALLTTAGVAAVTVGWTAGSGTEGVLGEQVLLRGGGGTGTPSPTPTPTGDPTAAPAPANTAVAGCPAAPVLANGIEYPAGEAPFSCTTAAWNVPVSSTCATNGNCIASWSQTVIDDTWQNGNQCNGNCVVEEADGDANIYVAASTDPSVALQCTGGSGYCDTGDNGGYPATMNIPAAARCSAISYFDQTMQVVQPNGTDVELAYGNGCSNGGGNWTSGATLTVGAAANCGNLSTGSPGFLQNGVGPSASGRCFAAGALRADELAAGNIDHALSVTLVCGGSPGGSTWQYPADPGATTNSCTNGANYGPPLGSRIWWDESCTTMSSVSGLTPSEIAIFCALDKYGAYFTDDLSGGGAADGFGGFTLDSDIMFAQYGQTNPYGKLSDWSSYGNCSNAATGTCYYLASHNDASQEWNPFAGHVNSGDDLDPIKHLHWLNACSAENQC